MRNTIYKLEDQLLYALDENEVWVLIGHIDDIVMFGSTAVPQDLPMDTVEHDYKTKGHGIFLSHPSGERTRLAKAYAMGAMRHYVHNECELLKMKQEHQEDRTKLTGAMLVLNERVRKLEDTLRACASNAGDTNLVGALVDDALNHDKEWVASGGEANSRPEPSA